MADVHDREWMQTVSDRLTRLEEREKARDDRMARMEATIEKLVAAVQALSDDVKAAKTGLRVGLGVWAAIAGVGGWFVSQFMFKR